MSTPEHTAPDHEPEPEPEPEEHHIPGTDEASIPELEADETVAPRPEEELADMLRAEPDTEDHSRHP